MDSSAFTFRKLAGGFRFTEGPIVLADGWMFFTDFQANRVYTFSPEAGASVLEEMVRPNGLALASDGELLICEGGTRQLSRRSGTGEREVVADRFEGKRLNSPNDVIVDSKGRIYFTDPPWSVAPEERELDVAGVYLIDESGRLSRVADDLPYPNGLALSPDETRLYVSNSRPVEERRMNVYDVRADGSLSAGRHFAWMTADAEGVPDGMKVHPSGLIFCTGPAGVWLFTPEGEHLGTLVPPEVPANCCFRPGFQSLVLTARTSIYEVDVRRINRH